ncbi:MAG: EFR1 family ferrodoxin, partial [Bacteroidaceae bacterium]|nr:EFR1 family ferrodoxin [Bacteroidaceae bacterium]
MIFYFSGTGNTRWAATQLAQAINEQLLFIPDEIKGNCRYVLKQNERLGFCFPTHGWMPPTIVRNFINKLHISNVEGHYCYALTTCGDD